jgi:ABC-type Na+ efflux pump permease subunit
MKTLPHSPNLKEMIYGWRYLAFQILCLGALLRFALDLLGLSLNDAQLNGLFFAINFAAVVTIFRKFLWAELQYALDRIPRVLLSALIGFLAVVVLCKVYMGITLEARERKQKEANKNA